MGGIGVWWLTNRELCRGHAFNQLKLSLSLFFSPTWSLNFHCPEQLLTFIMPLSRLLPSGLSQKLRALRSLLAQKQRGDTRGHLTTRLLDVFLRTWDLGFTAFGGPPVHFQILHQRFVEGKGGKEKWVDEQTVCNFVVVQRGSADQSCRAVSGVVRDMSGASWTR